MSDEDVETIWKKITISWETIGSNKWGCREKINVKFCWSRNKKGRNERKIDYSFKLQNKKGNNDDWWWERRTRLMAIPIIESWTLRTQMDAFEDFNTISK